MPILVLLRHGQSLWNREGRFTGWTDIDLSDKGVEEARLAGNLMRECGLHFDIAYTSVLKRAVRTLWIVLDEMDLMWLPVTSSWRLNERCYGALQGLSKRAIEEKFGAQQVHRWRRGFRDRPPALDISDDRYKSILCDPRYMDLERDRIPRAESLENTIDRVLPCWNSNIASDLRKGRLVFISAHGNSLRALVKYLDKISNEDIENFEIPTGVPLVYELNEDLLPKDRFYLKSREDCSKLHLPAREALKRVECK
jgi:2,3-bisphosphoglycerate-dependent phosphoglycerate mutase